jgi:FkbM family methyltransferase
MRSASGDYAGGLNELPVQAALVKLLRPGGTFLDVGANVGFFSLIAARTVGPHGTVVAVEAVGRIAEAARRNAKANRFSNITVLHFAVGAGSGDAVLTLSQHPGGATTHPHMMAGETVHVRQVSVDDLVDREIVPLPDVVKIDVEGTEPAVLDGMRRTLENGRSAVLCEVDAPDEQVLQARVAAVQEQLRAVGYRVDRLPRSYEGSGWSVEHLLATPS